MYRGDNNNMNCPQRLCPDTPNDPYGLSSPVPSGTAPNSPPPTGPNEIWWSPYDPTQVPDGAPGAGFKNGLLSPFLGTTNNLGSIFTCPIERQWQCGYAMNYTTGSPAGQKDSFVTQTSVRLIAWDHRRTPGCSDSRVATPPRPPFLPFIGASSETHYPPRHRRVRHESPPPAVRGSNGSCTGRVARLAYRRRPFAQPPPLNFAFAGLAQAIPRAPAPRRFPSRT